MNWKSNKECFTQLFHTVNALKITVENQTPDIISTLDGKTKLIKGCPSKNSQAELIFRGIQKKFRHVSEMMKEAENMIWNKD
jgi:hypothetical protein